MISRLGAGGMGEVWRAEDTRLLRAVAIKILSERIANDTEWKTRFLREARTVASLNHPNIATIYAIDQEGPTLYIAMELIEGEALTTVLKRGRLAPHDAVRIVRSIAEALAEAHDKGVVHRDIKPDNVLITRRSVKVLDFGIAKHVNASPDEGSLTQAGMIVGTPHYMSPEQALGRHVDPRTDIFSLGVVLYEALAGHRPFLGDSVTATMMQIITAPAPDVTTFAPEVPPELAAIVDRCLQKKPCDRFESADELAEALNGVMPLLQPGAAPLFSFGGNAPKPATAPGTTPLPRASNVPTTPLVAQTPPEMPRTPTPPETPRTPTPPPQQPIMRPPSIRPPAASSEPVAAPQPKDARAGQRALVADDDPVARHLLGSVLSKNRVAYDEVSNGADGVKCLKQNDYTMIFVDLLMPRIDGWGVLDFLRRAKPDKHPRVFIVTGVKHQTLSAVDEELVSAVLYKPLDPEAVERLVRSAVGA